MESNQAIQEAIVLAGGLGTRLREAVPDVPKCMAPVAGRPFITYVIDYLRMQGVQHFIFSLGYQQQLIQDFLRDYYPTLSYECIVEMSPLGTGGAIQLALSKAQSENILVANGDTLYKIDVKAMAAMHIQMNAVCTIALKPLQQFDRYGVVKLNSDNSIHSFHEKKYYESGLINGGIYIINKDRFLLHSLPQVFSIEKDYFEKFQSSGELYGVVQDGYFIDIGIPADYNKAQQELSQPKLDLSKIDRSWSLFLDRDGVINKEKVDEYILTWDEFAFNEGTLEAFKKLSETFSRIVIVSNQRGVGKGLMSEADLEHIHLQMKKEVITAGGHIDQVYYCTGMDNRHSHRKPNPGMALQATTEFRDINLTKAIMVGNKLSDMQFGRNTGMFTVFLATTNPEIPFPHPDIDLRFDSLYQFAQALKS